MAKLLAGVKAKPFAAIGVVIGLAIFAIFTQRSIQEHNRIIKIEAHTPCLNLTARQCALKLFELLPPKKRRLVIIRQTKLSHLKTHTARGSGARSSPRRSPVVSSPPTGSKRRGSSGTNNGTNSGNPGNSGGGNNGNNEPGKSGGGGGNNGGGSSDGNPNSPIGRIPPVTTPGIGPLPPLTTPTLSIPCPQTPVIKTGC